MKKQLLKRPLTVLVFTIALAFAGSTTYSQESEHYVPLLPKVRERMLPVDYSKGYSARLKSNSKRRSTTPNVPWKTAVNEDGTFKSADEVRRIYTEGLGLNPSEEIITYCRIGERSSHTWFALTYLLGYAKVRNYDGSWTSGETACECRSPGPENKRSQIVKAIHLIEYGNPETALKFVDIPEPSEPKARQVLTVEYSPINYSDLLLARGAYALKPNSRPTVQI